jgi:putative transposase
VRRVLDRIAIERGLPQAIVVVNGPESRGRALAAWSEERGVRLEFLQLGKPVQNAYIESFNGRLRGRASDCRWASAIAFRDLVSPSRSCSFPRPAKTTCHSKRDY